MGEAGHYLWFGAGLVVMISTTVLLARAAGAGVGWLPAWAVVRAAAQLTVVALLLRGILAAPVTVIAFLALMLTTASWTVILRISGLRQGRRAALLGVLVGSFVAVSATFALHLVDAQVRYLVAVAGIVIGNAMSAATLSGRNFLRGSFAHRDEIEAWLSLGATPAVAHDRIGREAIRESLLPTLDQTKSTGLVTLPGAFVGALFGGASPAEAAQFQLAVLAAIALAMTVTSTVVIRVARSTPYLVEAAP